VPVADDLGAWQERIQALYTNVQELYAHIDITVVVFDRQLAELSTSTTDRSLDTQLAELARRVIETGKAERDVVLDHVGRRRAHGFPFRDGGNSVAGVVCVVDDDGARRELFVRCAMAIFDGYRQNEVALLERERQALAEAQRANLLRDQFLAVVSHELRSPLAAILLWENVMRGPAVDHDMRMAALDAIHESATSQALLVADLLDVSRAINGKLHIDRNVTSLKRVLLMAIESVRPNAEARHLELRSDLDPDLGHVLGDSRRLRQIFDNLLSNAIKCTDHGHIAIRARQDDRSVTIEVHDTGCGIASEHLQHLFEPFWQADATIAPDGLGLGLAVAHQLVALHGGALSAASEGVGCGATFVVTLPRVDAPLPEDLSHPDHIEGIRVLVVDDDARILDALQLLLRGAGGIITTARSGASAYRILERDETDIVLSDLAMTGEDGCSLIRRVRAASGSMRSIPAIAITAQVGDDNQQRALEAGFDRYLTKPINVPLLISIIGQLCADKRIGADRGDAG
jgi:signal transduction histidine kinase/CheY-like chemotaxis protein